MNSIFVVARISIYREGLVALFGRGNDFVVCGSAATLAAARACGADLVVLDCSDSSPNILSICGHAPADMPPIVAVGLPNNLTVAVAYLEAGAVAFVAEEANVDSLYEVVLAAAERVPRFPPQMTEIILERLRAQSASEITPTFRGLTAREFEIAELMGAHQSNKEIARALGISVHTVKIHVHHVIQKLALHRRSEARDALHGLGRRRGLSSAHVPLSG
jgi:two-component system, NarL family, nitrate/nitrite response regulator NarL